jgi:hypothetical protein
MKSLRTVALISAVFAAVGPAVGAVVIWLERPPGSFGTVLLLSYAFGGLPALIAGIVYGGVSVRGRGAPSHWYAQALLGAGAGLLGCLFFFLFVSVFDLLTVSGWTVGDLEIRFLRRSVGAGIPAGIICALLVGSRRAQARTE